MKGKAPGRTHRALAALVLACLAAVSGAASAAADPTAPLGHAGRWITDADGRVVILHGVNMVSKRPPYTPATTGFDADDADFLREQGLNTVRLGIIHKGLEPQPGAYNEHYLNSIAATEQVLANAEIFTQIDFHQDLYNEKFQGEGEPDWAVQDDGLPNPTFGFPGNYLFNPATIRAFDHFWANDPGPGGVGLQDRYAAAFRYTALRFQNRSHVMGYDLFNEPWPGSVWPTCANNLGCPAFDAQLTAFSKRVIAAIRQVDQRNLVWYEPHSIFNSGADTNHGDTGDERAGMSFHIYCLRQSSTTPLFPGNDPAADSDCPPFEQMVSANAEKQSQETGDALLISEFGATDEPSAIRRIVDQAEQTMVSWQYWHYCDCEDPTTSGPGVQSIVLDPHKPPTGTNVKDGKLDILSRPYPQAVAGTPQSFKFDPQKKAFNLAYATRAASGGNLDPNACTEVFVPARHYPDGYRTTVKGGRVISPDNARELQIVNDSDAKNVEVSLAPRSKGEGGKVRAFNQSCAARLDQCLPSKAKVGKRGVGAVGLRKRRNRIVSKAGEPTVRRKRGFRYCVKGGGRVVVSFRKRKGGKSRFVATTARLHKARGIHRGTRAGKLRRAFPNARRIGRGYLVAAKGRARFVFRIRKGRVRMVGVASRRLTKSSQVRSDLRRALGGR